MPMMPKKACAHPGCPRFAVVRGRCEQHATVQRRQDDRYRGTRHERGYDNRWFKFARWYLAEPQNVRCRDPYGIHGEIGQLADLVDHIVPLKAGGEQYELENLQPLCKACHHRKTMDDKAKYGSKL
jgi:5-methylcytosine-specific restriction endonuclease McrA